MDYAFTKKWDITKHTLTNIEYELLSEEFRYYNIHRYTHYLIKTVQMNVKNYEFKLNKVVILDPSLYFTKIEICSLKNN